MTLNIYQNRRQSSFILLIAGITISLSTGILVAGGPVVAVIGLILVIVGLTSIVFPNIATQAFIFLLYTNLAVVSNKFHGVPFIISASFPLILVVPFVYQVILRREKLIITPIFCGMLSFLLVQVVGTLFAVEMSEAFANVIIYSIEALAIYFLLTNVIRSHSVLRSVLSVTFVAGIVLGIFPIIQFATNTTDSNYGGLAQIEDEPGFTTSETLLGTTSQVRYSGAIGEKNRFAQTMFMLMMIALPYMFQSDSHWWRLLGIITVVVTAIAGILAFSRGAAIGIAVAFLIAVVFRMFSIRQIVAIVLITFITLAAVPQYTGRIVSISSLPVLLGIETDTTQPEQPDGALEGRLTEMYAAFLVFVEHPVVGVGPGMFKYYVQDIGNQLGIERLEGTRRSHSLYLDILSNNGALGFLLFLMIVTVLLRQLRQVYQRFRKRDLFLANAANGFYLGLLNYLAIGVFLHFAYIRYFWTTIALASAVVLVAKQLDMSSRQCHKSPTNISGKS